MKNGSNFWIEMQLLSKKDLKENYGMAISVGKEWFEQMEAFEEWMIGKQLKK